MVISTLTWVITLGILTVFLVGDVIHMSRHPHEPSPKEAGTVIAFYIGAALLFAVGIGFFGTTTDGTSSWAHAGDFLAGYLTEYSLSIDNLFVFLLVMSSMAVPRKYQQFALMLGIILALIFRGIFIAVGAVIIDNFAWAFFLFGAFLVYTAWKLVADYRKEQQRKAEGDAAEAEDATDNAFMRWVKRVIPSTDEYHETHMSVKIDGKRVVTPMFFVVAALGSIDLMFALDSIPAIFGLTQEPYLVFTANFFALMGLRQLYFLLGHLLERLVYLSLGLSFILAFIGVKLFLHAAHVYGWIGFEVPTWLSLVVIIVTLIITAVLSLRKSARDEAEGKTTPESAAADAHQRVSDDAEAMKSVQQHADATGVPDEIRDERPDTSASQGSTMIRPDADR